MVLLRAYAKRAKPIPHSHERSGPTFPGSGASADRNGPLIPRNGSVIPRNGPFTPWNRSLIPGNGWSIPKDGRLPLRNAPSIPACLCPQSGADGQFRALDCPCGRFGRGDHLANGHARHVRLGWINAGVDFCRGCLSTVSVSERPLPARPTRSGRSLTLAVLTAARGFGTESLVVVTTLTNAAEEATIPRSLVGGLDIRAIKITLGMDILRRNKPERIRKEIRVCLLGYNLIRQTVLQPEGESGRSPRQLSLTAAMQSVAASWLVIVSSDDPWPRA